MNNWNTKLLAPSSPNLPVLQQVRELFDQQRATWDMFRNGEAALAGMRIKTFSLDGSRCIVQANPGRSISTNAKVDNASVASRPCFLCPDNLPLPERGISFEDFIMLPNPFPILKNHMTIAYRKHLPQQIESHITDLLAITRALGPDMFVIYNGPRCGASAPDHMHFQACSNNGIPLFDTLPADSAHDQIVPRTIWGRNILTGSFKHAEEAQSFILSTITALKNLWNEPNEPLINIVALFHNDRYILNIFPRVKHRSSCYFAEPQQQIAISPAAIEMAGIIVVANVDHFDRVDETVVQSMYKEVTLGDDLFSRLKETIR